MVMGWPRHRYVAEAAQIDLDAVVGRLAEIEIQQATLGERREASQCAANASGGGAG